MTWKLDSNGYLYKYQPTNIYANKAGKVYQHILVMCTHLGRKLNQGECVHHIDRDKTNNNLDNLMLLSLEEHAKLHSKEDRNVIFEDRICPICQKTFKVTSKSDQQYCSQSCFKKSKRKFKISKE